MKKISYLLMLVVFLPCLMMTNCKEDEPDGIVPPKDTLQWDKVFEYPVEVTTSESSYEGANVEIDWAAIAAEFKISEETLMASIADSIDDPDVTLYGIGAAGDQAAVVGSASGTNGIWGHWWSAAGVNTSWGSTTDSAVVFAEYYAGNTYFSVGQFPGRLKDGQVVEFYEAIKLEDWRVALHFKVTAKKPADVVATIVNTQELNITVKPNANWAPDSVQFNLATTLTDLGIASAKDIEGYVAYKADGSFRTDAETGTGYWYDTVGSSTLYSKGGLTVFTTYAGGEYIAVGPHPDFTKGGSFVIKYGILANDKIEMFKINVTVPKSEAIVATVIKTQALSISMDTIGDYSTDSVLFDLSQTLTDLGITSISDIQSVVTYDTLGNFTNKIAADPNVFWYDLEGRLGAWGEKASVFVQYVKGSSYVHIGQYPGNLADKVGNTYTVKYGFLAGDKVEMLEIAVTLTAATTK